MTARERDQPREIVRVRDRALRIRGRGEIERDRAREQIVVERIEIGKKAGLRGRRQIDRLAIGGVGAGRIGARSNGLGIRIARRALASARHCGCAAMAPRGTGLRGCRSAPGSRFRDRAARGRSKRRASQLRDGAGGNARCPCSRDSGRIRRYAAANTGPTKGGTGCCGSPTAQIDRPACRARRWQAGRSDARKASAPRRSARTTVG